MNELTFRILAVLLRAPADGQTILHRLRSIDEGAADPSLPTLYRSLKHGMQEQWIEATTAAGDAAPGRPPQRYGLTATGREAVRAEAQRHRAMADLVFEVESGSGAESG